MKKTWAAPRVVTREFCRFAACEEFAEVNSRGYAINGYCAGHRKQLLQKRPLREIRRRTIKERLVEFGSQIADESMTATEFEQVLHNFYVFVRRARRR